VSTLRLPLVNVGFCDLEGANRWVGKLAHTVTHWHPGSTSLLGSRRVSVLNVAFLVCR